MATRSLDEAVDRLYQLPLGEFIAARNAAASEFGGDEAKTIRSLQKPNSVAWALNQLYWTSRPVYDRLVEAAAKLRSAQADALMGRPADLRAAGEAHRVALQRAVREAGALLQRGGHAAPPDAVHALTAALEALPWPEPRGRLVRPPSPMGFAALAGLPTAVSPTSTEPRGTSRQEKPDRPAAKPAGSASVIPFEKGTRAAAGHGPAVRETPPERARDARRPKDEAKREKEESARRKREEERRERERPARETLDRARQDAEAASDRLRASEKALAGSHDVERAALARTAEARRLLAQAEAAHAEAVRAVAASESALRAARREAESSAAAARKAEQAWQRASGDA